MEKQQRFPKGWNAERVAKLLAEQEQLTEKEQVAADEAAVAKDEQTMVGVPNRLLTVVRRLLVDNAKSEKE